ncbi:nonstructural protein [Chlamydia phage 2]|uniref:Nonstructural protein n=1 Tax=Chlamydia phage 2 TaxID=105154 RepID=Q9MBU4_9VIRU|nr:nonstructural protein [Chlamydia phage 2]CAB85591.1 nonstructural protein [Chlamydia phage 2]
MWRVYESRTTYEYSRFSSFWSCPRIILSPWNSFWSFRISWRTETKCDCEANC